MHDHAPQAPSVSNSAFLAELARAAPNGSVLWVTRFRGSPDFGEVGRWHGQPYTGASAHIVDAWSEFNTYFCTAALVATADGNIHRRKANFVQLASLLLDDAILEDIRGRVSLAVETSPGKNQVNFFLDPQDPDTRDLALIDRLLAVLIERGNVRADSAGNSAVRYGRLPVGQNQKPRDSGAFSHRVLVWDPSVRYSLADAAAAIGIDLDTLRHDAATAQAEQGQGAQDEKLRALAGNIVRGVALHDSCNGIAASLVANSVPGGTVVNLLRALMDCSAAPRDDRWLSRFNDIPRAVSSAQDKFMPVVRMDFLQQQPPAPAPASIIPAHLLRVPGVLGLAVDWINATARKPQPSFAVQAALALGSVIMGRRYRTTNANWPMLYFLDVGLSGSGKEHAKFAVESLLEQAQLASLIGSGRFASESGVVSSLIEKPANFSAVDEFGKVLQSASASQNFAERNTIKALVEIWGRADGVVRPVAYSTAGLSSKQAEDLSKRVVRKPSLTLLAMATPDTLYGGLSSEAVSDGFLNRFIIVQADNGRQEAREVEHVEPASELLEWMRATRDASAAVNAGLVDVPHDLDPSPVVIRFSREASARFRAFERSNIARANALDDEGLQEMPARRTETAMRVAIVVAVSCGHVEIRDEDAAWACEYVEFHSERCIDQLRDRLSDGPFDRLIKEVSRLIINAGGKGLTEREIDQRSRAWRASNERMRQDALAALVRREQIALATFKSDSGRGRARKAYVDRALIADSAQAKSQTNVDKTQTVVSTPESEQ